LEPEVYNKAIAMGMIPRVQEKYNPAGIWENMDPELRKKKALLMHKMAHADKSGLVADLLGRPALPDQSQDDAENKAWSEDATTTSTVAMDQSDMESTPDSPTLMDIMDDLGWSESTPAPKSDLVPAYVY